MSKFLIDLRTSFWFVPALVVIAGGVLALLAVELDGRVGSEALSNYPRLFGAGAEGTRQLLSAIASSTVTVAGVVFSITIVALSLTAAQYSPRVLRSFMADRTNQLVLGVFLGIYVYCLIVLRTIQGGEEAFVPGISVVLAIVLALIGVAYLIVFIHHISTSIQSTEITARIARDTIDAIKALFAIRKEGRAAHSPHAPDDAPWSAVPATRTGYLQTVDHAALLDYARERKCVVRMQHTAGDFVAERETLLSVTGAAPDKDEIARLNEAYAVNTYRDVAQDPAFGVQQLVDIALKALSPGVNDTATARIAMDYLVVILMELTQHEVREEERLGDGEGVLVIARARSIAYFVGQAFDAIRRNAAANVDMLLHAIHALERVAACSRDPQWCEALSYQLAAICDAIESGDYAAADTVKLAQAAERVQHALSPPGN